VVVVLGRRSGLTGERRGFGAAGGNGLGWGHALN
jgi:hypothetical protein